MWSHTRFLEYLVIACTIAPAELVRVLTSFDNSSPAGRARMARIGRLAVPGCYLLVTALALTVAVAGSFLPGYLTIPQADWRWLGFALAAGCLLVGLELAIGILPAMARGARRIRIGVAGGYGMAGPGYLASILLTAVAEEVLYRGLWIGILHEMLDVPVALAIGIAAIGYGLGHLFFGFQQVAQKVVAGALFGVLLVATGSLLVPIVAHLAQNLAVFVLAARAESRA